MALWIYAGLTVGISFLCSLLEAALLSSSPAALDERREEKGVKRLLLFKTERIDDALSAILTFNTVANTFGAVMVGAEAERWARQAFDPDWASTAAGAVAVVLTLSILAFAEIIPKTLGAVYSRQLAGFVGHMLFALTRLLAPVLILTRTITRLLTRGGTDSMSRGEVAAFLTMATQSGALEAHESDLYQNLMRFGSIKVRDVMTPRTVAVMVEANMTLGEFLDSRETKSFSRIPVYEETRDEVTGYALQTDVLRAAVQGVDRSKSIREFTRPACFLPDVVNIADALRFFVSRREPLALVTDERGSLVGLLTREDVVETILGEEILDESDKIVDLRQVAIKMRDQRIRELEKRHEFRRDPEAEPDSPSH